MNMLNIGVFPDRGCCSFLRSVAKSMSRTTRVCILSTRTQQLHPIVSCVIVNRVSYELTEECSTLKELLCKRLRKTVNSWVCIWHLEQLCRDYTPFCDTRWDMKFRVREWEWETTIISFCVSSIASMSYISLYNSLEQNDMCHLSS